VHVNRILLSDQKHTQKLFPSLYCNQLHYPPTVLEGYKYTISNSGHISFAGKFSTFNLAQDWNTVSK
jgi:hypothetical protein